MTLIELSDITGADLCLRRYSGQGSRWSCALEHAETKDAADAATRVSTFGNADSPETAMSDYAEKLRGKLLVVGTAGRTYQIPETLFGK